MVALLQSDALLKRQSYYEASVTRAALQPSLNGEVKTDVVVVGAGFAGLSAAIELAQRGFKVAVVEADRVCSGASGRNGGQVIVGFASGQQVFEQQLGLGAARQAWDMSLEAIDLIDQRIAQFGIDCERKNGYLYVADSVRKAKALDAEMDAMEKSYGLATVRAHGAAVRSFIDSPRYVASAYETRSGHLHPLKYGLGLAQAALGMGVQIYENTAALSITQDAGVCLRTEHGQVRARYAMLAGNCTLPAFGPQLAPSIAARVMPVGTYIVATERLDPALVQRLIPSGAAACDNNVVLDYFRFSQDARLLFGGRVSYSSRTPARLQQRMAERMATVFPQLRGTPIEFTWGGFVDISMNRAPDFGRLGKNVYYLQGFSGHGVALTGLAGQLVAQAMAGEAARFELFSRLQHRDFPGGPLLRAPSLVLGMLYHRIKDYL
jgi:gamma-glutamylputrescine oxidase